MTYICAYLLEFLIKSFLYLLSFVETPRKFIIAELSIRKLKIRAMQTYKKLIKIILIIIKIITNFTGIHILRSYDISFANI